MPIPGLIDTYAFSDWLKVEYRKAGRPQMLVSPENGGLLTVTFLPKNTPLALTPKRDELADKVYRESQLPGSPVRIVRAYPDWVDDSDLNKAIAEAEEMP